MLSTLLKWAESLNCRRWEDFTTDTNDGQLEQSLPQYIQRPRSGNPLVPEPIRQVVHNSATRQVLSETEEFVPSRVLLALFQRDRIFGKDTYDSLRADPEYQTIMTGFRQRWEAYKKEFDAAR